MTGEGRVRMDSRSKTQVSTITLILEKRKSSMKTHVSIN